MAGDNREPLLNARFRVEIAGVPSPGVVEVILPEARISATRGRTPAVQYGALTLRRAMTASNEWYRWWDQARRSPRDATRPLAVVLTDRFDADVSRWSFSSAVPSAYAVSPLNAVRGELLIETLELSVDSLTVTFGADETSGATDAARSRRSRPRRSPG